MILFILADDKHLSKVKRGRSSFYSWTVLETWRLRFDPNSPRRRQRRSVAEIAKSIREFGFVQPIVVDEDNMIIIGHGRMEAAKRLGYETVPVVVVKGLKEEQRRRLQIADNRLRELSDWDESGLIDQLEWLYDGKSLEIPGFCQEEINDMLGLFDISTANCELPPQKEKTTEQSELHLLVSCRASHLDKMGELIAAAIRNSLC